MPRIVITVVVLIALSLFGVNVLNDTVVAPENDAKTAAKLEPQKSPNPRSTRSIAINAENGHFATDARVDGRPITFMVDTGASHITIRESEADRLGYHPSERDYVVRIHTANGEGRAARVELDTVVVGDIIVREVPALVVPDAALSVNLLGMSFLSRVKWMHERGQLVLEQ